MRLNKIISLALALVLILSSLTSCAKTPEELVKAADGALAGTRYSVEVELDFDAEHDVAKGIFDQLERQSTVLYYDGDSFKANNDLTIDYGDGEVRFISTYTVIDGMLYVGLNYSYGEVDHTIRSKALIDSEKRETLENQLSLVGGLSLSNFLEARLEKKSGDSFIVCSGVNEDGLVALERMLVAQLESSSDVVKALDATMTVEIDGERYDTVTVVCDYEVKLDGMTYTVTMKVELEYDYDGRFDIQLPREAEEYGTVDIDTLV